MSEFSKNIPTNLHQTIVRRVTVDIIEDRLSRICLELFIVRDNLNDSLPDLVAHMITSHSKELQGDIDVPFRIGSILLCQDGNFQNHFFTDGEVSALEIFQELIDNGLSIGRVTHAI